jgi:hypothetical protein
MPLLVIGLVALLVVGYRAAEDEAEACRDAKIFAWFQSEMAAEDAVIRDLRPSIPDADRATQLLSLSLEYESASRSYRVLSEIVAEEASAWLPWPELGRALDRRAKSAEFIATVYEEPPDALAASERRRIAEHAGRIGLADTVLQLEAAQALRDRGFGFDVQSDGRFVVRC